MQLGMVGLGRMGDNMAERLRLGGHSVVGYDRNPDVSDVADLAGLVAALDAPRTVWVMVPAGDPTESTMAELRSLLSPGDLMIDGGNADYTDSVRRAGLAAEAGMGYVDAGVSGGVWGLTEGYALMVGGDAEHVERLMPALETLSPPEGGLAHVGPAGSGHFTKMVHNAIEYGMMHAFGEGYELLAASELGIDVPAAVGSWQNGSVVRSWLLDLMVRAIDEDPGFESIAGYANDSGEARWAMREAVRLAVPLPVTSAALFARFVSRQDDSPAMKVIAALRNQFGGHATKAAEDDDGSGAEA
ncbi:MAG: phosphogluconate dehydrogenase (NAD(+)-dependent, decarboxylating) [Actinomycetota bacterium]